VSITKSDSPDPVREDKLLTYTLTVRNAGPFDAVAVTATDPLPKTVELKSASTTRGSCGHATANQIVTVTCKLGNLASGASATVTIVVKRLPTGTLTNAASVRAVSPGDPNPSNNSATATTTVTR